jgi:lambda family phage minor tail protein L
MPKVVSASFIAEKNKEESSELINLFDIEYQSGSWVYLADYPSDVVFPSSGGHTYTAFPISLDRIGESKEGSVEQVKITVANASRIMSAYVEDYNGLRGMNVYIRTVFANLLSDPTACLTEKYVIDFPTITEDAVSFTCTSSLDLMEVELPPRRFLSLCSWAFKGAECLYAGSGATCTKTIAACRVYGNGLRFGGFPGVKQWRNLWY